MTNILDKAKDELLSILSERGVKGAVDKIAIPPREEMGDLSFPLGKERIEIGIIKGKKFIREVRQQGIYLNAFLDEKEVFRSLFPMDRGFGIKGQIVHKGRILVEHTSANPVHPLHIGHLRNSVLGDTLVRLLRETGHEVKSHFYVNDSGRQVGILAYGLEKIGWREPPSGAKPDIWYGIVYAMTNTILEIKELKAVAETGSPEDRLRLDEKVAIASELRERDSKLFDELSSAIMEDPDPEGRVGEIIRLYESGDPEIGGKIRLAVNRILSGFEQTLSRLGASFNSYDYESDLLWRGDVGNIIRSALRTQYVMDYKGTKALRLDLSPEEKKNLKIPPGYEIPPLVLMRNDGTSLYTVRDIAYTLKKFEEADFVINVIAEQQTSAQSQLRAALYLLGYIREAENLLHYSYSMVRLEGGKMSGRSGKYVTVDQLIDTVKAAVEPKVKEKGGDPSISEALAIGAIRYAILSVSASKVIDFSIGRATDLEQNSGPYLQYTYVRALSVLRKAGGMANLDEADLSDIGGDKRKILMLIAKFPDVIGHVLKTLSIEDLASYTRSLADLFNSWYGKERILLDNDRGKTVTRLAITQGVETVLGNSLRIMGIPLLTSM